MTQQCSNCRFWQADPDSANFDDEPHAYGNCRRFPPAISDHLLSIVVGRPGTRDEAHSEEFTNSSSLYQASPLPATFCNDWCGEYADHAPAVPL